MPEISAAERTNVRLPEAISRESLTVNGQRYSILIYPGGKGPWAKQAIAIAMAEKRR